MLATAPVKRASKMAIVLRSGNAMSTMRSPAWFLLLNHPKWQMTSVVGVVGAEGVVQRRRNLEGAVQRRRDPKRVERAEKAVQRRTSQVWHRTQEALEWPVSSFRISFFWPFITHHFHEVYRTHTTHLPPRFTVRPTCHRSFLGSVSTYEIFHSTTTLISLN